MSILIKGMEMPKNCRACRFAGFGGRRCELNVCMFTGESQPTLSPERMSACPLVPVPPHYDLIDHNALKIAVMNCDCETRADFLKHTMDCINKAPVVIPSDMPTYEAEEGEA